MSDPIKVGRLQIEAWAGRHVYKHTILMYYNILWSKPEGAGERLVLLCDSQGVAQLLHGGEAVGEVTDDVEHLPHAHAGEHLRDG